jgi:hypothetical protein
MDYNLERETAAANVHGIRLGIGACKFLIPFVVLMLMLARLVAGEAPSPHSPSSLLAALQFPATLDFCKERVPVERPEIRERFEKELLLSLWDRPQVILWLKRSRRYLPIIEKALAKKGLPQDLKYVALAESALRPHVSSTKGAIGFWQFMAPTGRTNGLVINRYRDERRNIETSTKAAIRYFEALYKRFGSWTLAAAAFNCGEYGLAADIEEQDVRDYYDLYLPLETERYIFRVLSAKLILSDPAKYGFHLKEGDYYPPIEADDITFQVAYKIPITIVAKAAQTHFKVIKGLNPEIRGTFMPKGRHRILVPKGSAEGFETRYRSLSAAWQKEEGSRIYIVEEGDNLSAIADRFGVSTGALIRLNDLDLRRPIHPGDRLTLPQK